MLKLVRAIWCCSFHHRQSIKNLLRGNILLEIVVAIKYPSTLLPRKLEIWQRFPQLFTKSLQFSVFINAKTCRKISPYITPEKITLFQPVFQKFFQKIWKIGILYKISRMILLILTLDVWWNFYYFAKKYLTLWK